jgi:hypothetical protein
MPVRRSPAPCDAQSHARHRSKVLGVLTVSALTASGLAVFSQPASAVSTFSVTLEACQQRDTPIIFPAGGPYVCPLTGDYTTGNLGKNWNELDYVPHRLTFQRADAGPATVTYGGDHHHKDGGAVGWEAVSELVLNPALSTAGCDTSPSVQAQVVVPGETGGASDTVERTATVDLPAMDNDDRCVYDYFQLIALGAHLYPGSSMQSYLTSGAGNKTISLPVKQAAPQKLSKDMAAVRNARQLWNVTKSPTPASVSFDNTCLTGDDTAADVDITVTWTKKEVTPTGDTILTSNIYASNPAARAVTVTVTDKMYAGTGQATQVGTTWTSAPTEIPANTANFLIGTNQQTVPSTVEQFNDVATGAYTDTVLNIPIPQTTTATASAQVGQGSVADSSVTITDVESMTGDGFDFAVSGTTGASGDFVGYTPGTRTTGPVTWTSATQTDSGSVTFHKTVHAARGTIGSGSLSDTATATATGGDRVVAGADLSVGVSADTKVALTIDKTIAPAADRALTFTFDVERGDTTVREDVPIAFAAGQLTGSTTVTGLAPGTYTVHEDALAPFAPQDSDPVTLSGTSDATCSASVGILNAFDPPLARVVKDSRPDGSESGWTFTLTGPGAENGVEVTTDADGDATFPVALGTGEYTMTETGRTGWDLTDVDGSVSGDGPGTAVEDGQTCKLTVNQLDDAGRTFTCTFTNTQRGSITVVKRTVPARDDQSFAFTLSQAGQVLNTFNLLNNGSTTTESLKPGTYAAAESLPEGWDTTSASCDDGSDPAAIDLGPGEHVTCTFVNTQRGRIYVDKVTDPSGDPRSFDFSLTGPNDVSQSFSLTDQSALHNSGLLLAGTYDVTESTPEGWDLSGASCDNGDPADEVVLDAGETVTCTFTNSKRGSIVIDKVTQPAGDGQEFSFDLTGPNGFTAQSFKLADGTTPHDSGAVRPGTYSASESAVAGWDLSNTTCSDGSPVTAIAVGPGEKVTCTFTNTKRQPVTVVKKENGGTPTTSYTFRLRGGPDSVDVERTTNSTNQGTLQFGSFKPGPGYEMCELAVGAGTHSSLRDAPYNGTLDSTTGNVCVTFTLTTAAGFTFTVNNTYPQGDARTIGYWKNWNTCAKASESKARKTGNKLMDWYLPQTLANPYDGAPGYVVTNCTKGVAVLGAASGKYAENQLAAQLLAAILNKQAGAKMSDTTKAKVGEAVTLLTKLKYKGPPSSIVGSTHAKRAAVLALATYLDDYNNNKVV